MTPTELFLIQMLNEAKETLTAVQRKFPMDSKYDNVVSQIARKRGEIEGAVGFILKNDEEKAITIANLLKQNLSDL